MQPFRKGSRPLDKIIGISQAAKMLQVQERVVRSFCKRGVLTKIQGTSNKDYHVLIHEISALAEVIHSKTSLAEVASIAMQAHVRARRAEKQLDELFNLMGWNRSILGLSEEDVITLWTQAAYGMEVTPSEEKEVRKWADIFFGIDEGYLGLVMKHTASSEPWKLFMDLAQKMSDEAPRSEFSKDPSLQFAYAYLEASREHLRQASYLFCRQQFGFKPANEVFRDGKVDPTERVIQLLYPH
jgi:hypothetical protein